MNNVKQPVLDPIQNRVTKIAEWSCLVTKHYPNLLNKSHNPRVLMFQTQKNIFERNIIFRFNK